ncbi:MAG: hypothetical protein GYB68_13355 [Chloroflexi bacterium]|nr:hypothetical protein [Chloroflexota bacterium]
MRLYNEFKVSGYADDTLMDVEDEGAIHNEEAWTKRLPDALRFLLK